MDKKHYKTNSVYTLLSRKNHTIIFIVFILFYLYFRNGVTYLPVENLNIPSGFSIDLAPSEDKFSVSMSFYDYHEEKKISSTTYTVVDSSLSHTIEKLQLSLNKKMITGVEKAYVFGEEYAKFGIRNLVDIDFKDASINDTVLLTICKGKAEDILNFEIPSYPNAVDYIEGMIESSKDNNFFSDNYKLIDVFVRIGAEGRNVVLPYIEIKEDKLQITGMALFKEDKMIRKIDMEETRIMNLLRENNVEGILVLKKNSKEYLGYYPQTSKKVHCEKKDGKYIFYIDLSLNGNIIENELFPDIHSNSATMEIFQNKMKKKVEKMSADFINKMQKDYEIDCLELGKVAASKYGRHRDIDWNKVVSNSEIVVNVEVKVENMGRGDY
ncbi:MAG: Ger(x)C family spore germination protein [Anaeromicrobium sp.]|jgi:Ger(x)C family germination protein|uniref:Ger(x)C family spore germination protein n=1 Tax=Anaeromicrobium sp. TaxID=1929132 RepID=UPI0025DDF47B|nr:Ger(x)C family spore germination protein [Anaeromicrobium sp.]MCT4594010.1 Ger(x)C family spore germination protein [Anaeromicrobium sp.]